MAVSAPWVLVWVPWLMAALGGSLWAALRLRGGATRDADRPAPSLLEVSVVLAWAVGLGAFSLWVLRPNPDDLFYLNSRSGSPLTGTFPLRDTLFADLDLPDDELAARRVVRRTGRHGRVPRRHPRRDGRVPLRASRSPPPCRSWRCGVCCAPGGSTSRPGDVGRASSSCSSTARRLRHPGQPVRDPAVAGQGHPALPARARPARRTHCGTSSAPPEPAGLPLVLGGVAAVGLTTTGDLRRPGDRRGRHGATPPPARGPGRRGFVALAAYPLAAGAVTNVLGGRSADDFGGRRLYRFDAVVDRPRDLPDRPRRPRWPCWRCCSAPSWCRIPAARLTTGVLAALHRRRPGAGRHARLLRRGGSRPDAVAAVVGVHGRGPGRRSPGAAAMAWLASARARPTPRRAHPVRRRRGLRLVLVVLVASAPRSGRATPATAVQRAVPLAAHGAPAGPSSADHRGHPARRPGAGTGLAVDHDRGDHDRREDGRPARLLPRLPARRARRSTTRAARLVRYVNHATGPGPRHRARLCTPCWASDVACLPALGRHRRCTWSRPPGYDRRSLRSTTAAYRCLAVGSARPRVERGAPHGRGYARHRTEPTSVHARGACR